MIKAERMAEFMRIVPTSFVSPGFRQIVVRRNEAPPWPQNPVALSTPLIVPLKSSTIVVA
jgi:hypothetical protein